MTSVAQDFERTGKVQGVHLFVHGDEHLDDRSRSVAVMYCTHLEDCIFIELVKRLEKSLKGRLSDVVIVRVSDLGL